MPVNRLLNFRLVAVLILLCAGGLLIYGIAQENPRGTLQGIAVAKESGRTFKATAYLDSKHKVDGETIGYTTPVNKDGKFEFKSVVAGEYSLYISAPNHTFHKDSIIIREARTEKIAAELQPYDPYMSLSFVKNIYLPDEEISVTCNVFSKANTLHIRTYKVDPEAFFVRNHGSVHQLLGGRDYLTPEVMKAIKPESNPNLTLISSTDNSIANKDAEGGLTKRFKVPKLGPGLYILEAKADDLRDFVWVMVTSLGVVTKSAPGMLLAYAVDLNTGKPIQSAEVTLFSAGKYVSGGKTNADGLIDFKITQEMSQSSGGGIFAKHGNSIAFVSPYISGLPAAENIFYVYTDRPVYRPSQSVFYKGIARTKDADAYKMPANKDVTVEVRDSYDTLIHRVHSKIDKFGGFSGSLRLNKEAPTGQYSVNTIIDSNKSGTAAGNFTVMAYRKPEFSVKITYDKNRYVRGDTVRAKISAQYYFGVPLVNADITYNISHSPYWLFEDDAGGEMDEQGYSQYGYGEGIVVGRVRTDARGEAIVTFVANWAESRQIDGWLADQRYSMSAWVTDLVGENGSGETGVIVTRGEFAISVQSDKQIVTPGSSTNVAVEIHDFNKRPVKNQEVSVTLVRSTWEAGEQGNIVLDKRLVKTDSHGKASFTLPVKEAGYLMIIASAKDPRRNTIKGSCYLYSTRDMEQAYFGQLNQLKIVTDKRTYSPGDTAKLLILTATPDTIALVSVEGSKLHEVRPVKLKGHSNLVEFPIKDEYKPNIYFSVSMVKKGELINDVARADVSVESRSLNVVVKPDKRRYKPGQKATYDLKVTDAKGKPVAASVSLGVVDEAIYAVQPDYTTPIADFFYAKTYNEVNTAFSSQTYYLSDPDKAGEALRDQPLKIRRRFLDTAYWNPTIVTDAQGRARVSFEWPDNLTTWRATARAITVDTLCGQSQNAVISQQDMLVQLQLPRFLVQGDSCNLVAGVHNYTGKDQTVKVRLSAPGLKILDTLERTVSVAKNRSQRVCWRVSAPKVGAMKVTVKADGQKAGDAVELILPVKPHGEQILTAENGVLAKVGESRNVVNIRNDSIPEATELKIRLAPSLAATMLGSLDYLASYPYGCTEQTVSRFLPDVILYRSLKSLGIDDPELEAKLPDMVAQGLSRLYRIENPNGGWGWNQFGRQDVWMTAYAAYSLILARDAGFTVDQGVLNRAINELYNEASSNKVRLYPRAFAAYVMAMAGHDSSKVMDEIFRRKNVNNEALAVLAMGFHQLGRHDQAEAALRRLFQHAIVSGDTHWEGISKWTGGDLEATALALQALGRIRPNDDRAYGIVRWLMSQRSDNYWTSTRGTAFTVYAMSEFLAGTKELMPDYDAIISINGKQIDKVHFDKASIFDPQVNITVPGRELRKGRNDLTIRKTGPGSLYVSTNLTQYIARSPLLPLVSEKGISIERSYYRINPLYFAAPGRQTSRTSISKCKSGDIILVRLTITAKQSVSHMMVEDFIPAGCEIADRGQTLYYEREGWWAGKDIRDDKIAFYVDSLAPGKRVIEYKMRAGFSGNFTALPAQFFSMYDPSARTTTGETGFVIK